jgi:hypothetical protein
MPFTRRHARGLLHGLFVTALLSTTACPGFAPYSKPYQGNSEWERQYLTKARRDVYPDDVRKDPATFRQATLAWAGVVVSAQPEAKDPTFAEVVIEHHYWDWIEDHSIQKAKAFLSPRGEGRFTCHAERRMLPAPELAGAMAVAYVRPVGIKDDVLHTACLVRFYPREWYATDVMDYGRDGAGMKLLRVPME